MTKIATTDWKHQLYFWGHLAKASVYLMVGGIAMAAVIGSIGDPKGPQRIVTYLQDETIGRIILMVLAAGLFAYCVWRFYKTFTDEANDGSDITGLIWRLGYAFSGIMYGLLGVYIVTLLFGPSTKGDKQDLIVQVMQSSMGPYIVGLLAAMALVAAYRQFHRVRTENYMEDLHTSKMNDKEQHTYRLMGKVGYASRVLVYVIIAYYLVRVVITGDPSKYKGIGGVLDTLYLGVGVWLMVIVSLGLLLYGSFVAIKSWYRQVD